MYSTKSMNGVPAIQREGRSVLTVWDQDWEFAHQVCELLNRMQDRTEQLTDCDREFLKAIDRAFQVEVLHA